MFGFGKVKWRILDEKAVLEALVSAQVRWTLVIMAVLAASILANIIFAYGLMFHFPVKQFIWTKDAAAVCDATPLTEPTISQARLKEFAVTAATELNTWDYQNWKPLINGALDRHFTLHGANQSRQALYDSGIVNRVAKEYASVSGQSFGPPRIIKEEKRGGRYVWEVHVPMTIFYSTTTESKRENRVLEFTIIRVDPSPINPNGVAIDGMVSRQALSTDGMGAR